VTTAVVEAEADEANPRGRRTHSQNSAFETTWKAENTLLKFGQNVGKKFIKNW
jgi:hypothetical protein